MESQNSSASRINLVSDDPKLAIALSSVLGPEFVFVAEPRGTKANQALDEWADVVVLDVDSSRGDQEQREALFEDLMASGLPVIVMAGDESRVQARGLVERGAQGYIRKPPSIREFKTLLRTVCEARRLKQELQAAQKRLDAVAGLDQLNGASAPMQLVYKLIRKVANLEATVLITGESGTGKELISRAIHNTGNRAKRPFVAVSCAAIPETLIESELFGHEKGAFTGTNGVREGYFEQAEDGTLFLDEIGELKLHTQVKLLRVLQQREFSRLGSSRMIPLRARVVLATHRDLSTMVAEGLFRQDLFYRVNVMNIPAPALRHRSSDIPALAQYFLMKYAEQYCKPVEGIESDAMALLQSYSWPGNVRELENVIQRAIILAEGYSIEVTDLPDAIQDVVVPDIEDDSLPNGSFERLLRDYKIKLAMDAVQQCNGSKTLAAQSLSISRAYLHRLIRPAGAGSVGSVSEISDSRLRIAG